MKRTRTRGHIVWAGVLVAAIALTWAAAWAILRVPEPEVTVPENPTVIVEQGEAGFSASAEATVRFDVGRVATSGSDGVVTSIDVAPGAPIEAGDVLLTIDMRPVVAMRGSIPAYRDLSTNNSGDDVAQLRAHFDLAEGDRFDWELEVAVMAWQRELGIRDDGVVRAGDVLFLPDMPARGAPAEDVRVGSSVTPGADLFVTAAPEATLLLTIDQLPRVNQGQAVTVHLPDGTDLQGTIGDQISDQSSTLQYTVVDDEGAPVCGAACASLFSPDQESFVPVSIEVIPVEQGLIVPNSAIGTGPSGEAVVQTPAGEVIEITVVVRGDGVSVVEGVDAGTEIRLFGEGS